MAEDIGIVMSLYDKVSPTLKAIAGNNRAFDKSLDELESSLKAYEKAQDSMVTQSAGLKKALAETDQKVKDAQKSYKKLKDETSKGALDAAIDEQTRLRQELKETETSIKANDSAYQALYKSAQDAATAASKADNRAEGVKKDGLAEGLRNAGLGRLASDAAAQLADTFLSSAIGEPEARLVSSLASGVISGATMGSIAGAPGAALGAVVGGMTGAISGGSQIYQARDDSFKSYVQESAQGQISARDEDISSGSAVAAGREQKQLAFSTLLGGDEAAAGFLDQVKDMAAATNYTYDEITGYAKSMVKPFGTEGTLDMLTTLSDTSAALSLGESDNSVLIAGLSRMKLTDKTTQEYLNYFSERGIDVYEALSKWGDAASVSEKVTKGEIGGSEAVEEILSYLQEQYGGLSEKMAGTYEGMMGNLEDAEANAQEAYGIGYNEKRKEGIQAQTDWLEGGAMDEANKAIGAWQAGLENQKEEAVRTAVDAAMDTEEYQTAQAAGDAAEMGRIIVQAKVRGMNEYNASDGAQLALASEKALVEGIRADTSLNQDYWDAGYEMGQEYSKGVAAGMLSNRDTVATGAAVTASYEAWSEESNADAVYSPHAYGLDRVPYDGYAALLHEGERVLTAREAREDDRGEEQGGGVSVHIDTINVGGGATEDDARQVVQIIADELELRRQAGAFDRAGG